MPNGDQKEAEPVMVPFPDMPSPDTVTLAGLSLSVELLKYELHDLQFEHERLKADYVKIKRGFREFRRGRFGRY